MPCLFRKYMISIFSLISHAKNHWVILEKCEDDIARVKAVSTEEVNSKRKYASGSGLRILEEFLSFVFMLFPGGAPSSTS